LAFFHAQEDTIVNVVKFPYVACRRIHSRKPRRSKYFTPEERAEYYAAAEVSVAATVTELPIKNKALGSLSLEEFEALPWKEKREIAAQIEAKIGSRPPAGAQLTSVASEATDPIFTAIEAHRAAHAAHEAAISEANRLQKLDRGFDWVDMTVKPCDDDNEAFDILIGAEAAGIPGLLAKLNYLRAIAESEEAWMFERDDTAMNLIDSFVASLRNVGVLS
jgi:hypothetical protein